MPTDNRILLGELIGEGNMRHRRYCKEKGIWPIATTNWGPVQERDSHFIDLKKMSKKS